MARRSPKGRRSKSRTIPRSSKRIWAEAAQTKCRVESSGLLSRRLQPLRQGDPMAILEVENVHTYYGHIHALKGISLTVEEGEIVTLIGANGAGKSTTLKTISGLL